MSMIRVYIKDNQIVKCVNEWYFDTEHAPEWATYQDLPFNINDHLVYEDDVVKLYKESNQIKERKKELEEKKEKTEREKQELDYINSLLEKNVS